MDEEQELVVDEEKRILILDINDTNINIAFEEKIILNPQEIRLISLNNLDVDVPDLSLIS